MLSHRAFRALPVLFALSSPARAEAPDAGEASAASAPPSKEQQAHELYGVGAARYEKGDYADAALAFRSAYELTAVPALLYNLAQAERLAGDCMGALRDYRRFEATHVESMPPDFAEKTAEMERCAHATQPEEPADRAASPEPIRQAARPTPPPKPPARHGDNVHHALSYGAAAGAVISASLGLVFAVREEASAQRLEQVNQAGGRWGPGYSAEEDSMRRSRDAAIGFFVASGLFAGATAWLLLGPGRARESKSTPAVSVDLGPGRASASAWMRF